VTGPSPIRPIRPTRIVGLSGLYHEATACLLVDGEPVAAASEERFSRVKHDPRMPVEAFRWCLEAGGLRSPADLSAVAWYELPEAKHDRQLWALSRRRSLTPRTLSGGHGNRFVAPGDLDPERPLRFIRERLGWDGPVLCYPHHLSHAASAYLYSGFASTDEGAAILTVDGVGEWATTTYATGRAGSIELIEEVRFPHSLGLFYSAVTALLGFRVNGGEYKVMGLAPYGEPRYAGRLREVVRTGPGGGFTLDLEHFDFLAGERMFSDALPRLLDGRPRKPGDELTPWHADVARSAQVVLEELLLEKVRYLHRRTGARPGEGSLCMAGGVALNCVANGRILREGPFRRLFVQPAAGDAGGALGAAALAHRELSNDESFVTPMRHVFLGPEWSPEQVARLLAATGILHRDLRGREEELLADVAERLAAGQVVGWFQGRMELGPRALGARSLLASPLDPRMRERINRKVKKREAFRPFAPAVLASRAPEHFELGPGSERIAPFMLLTCAVRSPLRLPAVTHVDGSARPQTVDPATAPRFAALLAAFEARTGCPVLLDTSFNVAGEPIVRSPAEALASAAVAGLDAVVIGDFLVDGADLPADLADPQGLLAPWREPPRSRFGAPAGGEGGLSETLYTFV
jgi:carbamoyltransferase